MHALVEIIAGMVAALAAAAMSQMGFDVTPASDRAEEREVRRTSQGLSTEAPSAVRVKSATEEC